MKKIIIIGCPGSGKSTFGRKLRDITGLPLYHLDMMYWNKDKTTVAKEVFLDRLYSAMNTEEWIIDGNYSRTVEERIKNYDTVFLFDLPTGVCIQGATDRLGKERYDLPWIDTELDSKFKKEIEDFPKNSLPAIYEFLDKYKENKTIVIFKSRQQADKYINDFKNCGVCQI